jgi:hypothetical protein
MSELQPSLFGLKNTNRDFTLQETWGKNQFNSSFPAALCCYLFSRGIEANYLSMLDGTCAVQSIPIDQVFGIDPLDDQCYFAFEAQHSPYQKYVANTLPRTDLVIQRVGSGECLSGLEIKLTALPDHTTCDLTEHRYGSEIVVRPDTIVYLACSIAARVGQDLVDLIPDLPIQDWADPKLVLEHIETIVSAVKHVARALEGHQSAFLIQPIWKTIGKSPMLANQCLDVFVWSDAAFGYFIAQIADTNPNALRITRQTRTTIWLFKMLHDLKTQGRFNHQLIFDLLSYNSKNDKAFASAGNVTNRYMQCPRLLEPAIHKDEIKHIILGDGQHLLSPERRFDAILFNSPELFKSEPLK